MSVMKLLRSTFSKIFTFGKKDIENDKLRQEKLSNVLRLVQRTSEKDWSFQRNRRVVKNTIYHKKHVGDDFISDGVCGGFYMPIYEIDESREPTKIYETWPYFFSLDHDRGFMTFHSSDDDVFCRGKIIGIINSETAIEEIYRDKSGIDADLLDFFDDLRMHFREG